MRVGLLKLVGRAVHEKLTELLQCPVTLKVARQRGPLVGVGDRAQGKVHVLGGDAAGGCGRAERLGQSALGRVGQRDRGQRMRRLSQSAQHGA